MNTTTCSYVQQSIHPIVQLQPERAWLLSADSLWTVQSAHRNLDSKFSLVQGMYCFIALRQSEGQLQLSNTDAIHLGEKRKPPVCVHIQES